MPDNTERLRAWQEVLPGMVDLSILNPRDECRFWRLVGATADDDAECWPWLGEIGKQGYGRFYKRVGETNRKRKAILAHRCAYWFVKHAMPPVLDHLCRNRACVRPDHLEPVTPQENIARGQCSGAYTLRNGVCPRGHVLAGEHLAFTGRGDRFCRTCNNCINREKRAAGHAADKRRRILGTACKACGAEKLALPSDVKGQWVRASCTQCGGVQFFR